MKKPQRVLCVPPLPTVLTSGVAALQIQLTQAVFHLRVLATHKQSMRVAISVKQRTAKHATLHFASCLSELPVLALNHLYHYAGTQSSTVELVRLKQTA
jgi:hypothetical protein